MRGPLLALALWGAAVSVALAQAPPEGDANPPKGDVGVTGAPAVALPPPLPDPPPGLELVPDTPGGRALAHTRVAEVLDTLGVRVGRQLTTDCAQAPAAWWGLGLVHAEAVLHVRTATAMLDGVSAAAELRSRLDAAEARTEHLAGILADAKAAAAPCEGTPSSPAVYLGGADLEPHEGLVAVYVQAATRDLVVWVDGRPATVTDDGGWAVLVLAPGERRLCAAPPERASCEGGYTVDAAMGSAYDLR